MNTLAYYENPSITAVISFIVQAQNQNFEQEFEIFDKKETEFDEMKLKSLSKVEYRICLQVNSFFH